MWSEISFDRTEITRVTDFQKAIKRVLLVILYNDNIRVITVHRVWLGIRDSGHNIWKFHTHTYTHIHTHAVTILENWKILSSICNASTSIARPSRADPGCIVYFNVLYLAVAYSLYWYFFFKLFYCVKLKLECFNSWTESILIQKISGYIY